jgi:hypothetical protein
VKKLLGLLISTVCTGCLSQTRPMRLVEAPDPVVGDLHCATGRMSVVEALYNDVSTPVHCETR